MNKHVLFFVFLILAVSCNKEKQSLKRLDGNWEITGYQEVIYDGTTNFYTVLNGKLDVEANKDETVGKVFITWKATHLNDTSSFTFEGDFAQEALDQLKFISTTDSLDCKIARQLKKDMTIGMVVQPNRKSILHLKKK